jgi:hypothetical protein
MSSRVRLGSTALVNEDAILADGVLRKWKKKRRKERRMRRFTGFGDTRSQKWGEWGVQSIANLQSALGSSPLIMQTRYKR